MSSVQTQMFLTGSQREASADLANRIALGFKAAGDSLAFSADVSRSMVQSAAQFKQIEIDEWWKNEQLKLQYKQMAIREQAMKETMDYRNRTLELRAKQMEGANADKEKAKEYNTFISDLAMHDGEIGSEMAAIESSKAAIAKDRDAFLKKQTAEINRIKSEAAAFPARYPPHEVQRRISEITTASDDYLSQLDGAESSSILREGQLNGKRAQIRSLQVAATNKGVPVNDLYENLGRLLSPIPPGMTGPPDPDAIEPTKQYYTKPDVKKDSVKYDTSAGPPAPPQWRRDEFESVFLDPSQKPDDVTAREVLSSMNSGEIDAMRNQARDSVAAIMFNYASQVTPEGRSRAWSSYKDVVESVNRWYKYDPNKDIRMDNAGGLIERNLDIVFRNAKLKYGSSASKTSVGGAAIPDIEENWSLTPNGKAAIKDSVNEFLKSNFNTSLPEENPGLPASVTASAGRSAASNITVPSPDNINPENKVNDASIYEKMFGLNDPDKSLTIASEGNTDRYRSAASALQKYEEKYIEVNKWTPELKAKELASYSDYELGFDMGSLSSESKMEAKTEWWNPRPVDYRKAKAAFIRNLIQSGAADKIIAEQETRKSGKRKEDIAFGLSKRREYIGN